MTGEENKIRVIVSQRLISPLSCCNNFNSKALEFRASIKESLSVSRLNPDIATKSMLGAKPTYEDTDNKKRDSTGATKPGVVEISPGIRTESKQAWENGRSLVLYPSRASKLSMNPEANFGWLKDTPDSDFNTANNRRKLKPQIKFTKYDVDPRTDDIIPSSETEIDMAYPSMGLSRAQRRRKKMHVENPKMQFKAGLPGRSLSSRIPDGDLLARTAGRFGIMRDANNKFRCPPGTPAANQFTNHLGTNCFGVSAERAAKFVADKIADLMKVRADDSSPLSLASGRKGSPREVLRSGADFDADGVKIPIPDARAMDVPETTRWFKNATINAQDSLKKQKQIIRGLLNNPKLRPEILKILGADDISEIDEMTNKDIYALFTVLQNNGLWDLKIVGGGLKGSPLDDNQVKELVMSRLESIPGWASLTPDEQNALIKADTTRYYESERAILETLLEQYVINPEHMRTVGAVVLTNEPLPDSSEATTSWSSKTKGADIRSVIKFHIPQIMENQETMIPQLEPRQRLMVSAEGAKTDAEAMSLVADFLINANYPAREMAAMVGGTSSFVRHITTHEIAHTIQGEAFLSAIFDEIKRTGGIEVFDQKGASKMVTEFENLTGGDLSNLMVSMQDNISIEGLNGVMSRIDNVAFLSGEYPTVYEEGSDHRALEVTAELFALRANGFIHGDDIDDALSWMDEALGKTTSEAREVMSLELLESLDEAYISPFSRGEDILPIRKHLRKPIELNLDAIDAARRKKEIKKFRNDIKGLDESRLVNELAERMGERDVLEELRNDPSISPAELKRVENDINQLNEYISAIFDSYRESFSMGGPESNKAAKEKLERLATELYLSAPPKSAKEAARRVELNRKNALRADAAVMTESELVKLIADYEVQINSLKPDDDKTLKLVTDKEIHVEQYILNKRAAGDTRTNKEIKNELRKKVTTEITASRDALDTARRGSMKPQQLKSKADIAMNAKKERARLRRSITKQQAAAVKEIDNFDEAGVTQILNPTNSAVVGRAINRRNARLRRLGLEIDDSSVDEGSLDKQVENILIPTMEAMDASSITTPFEMELFLDSSVVTGVKRSKEIELSTFSQGKVLSKNMKPGVRPKGSKKKRVIVRMKEGDRGLFPLAGKDSNQKFVIPPGKMRVVGRSKDGSLIVEVSSQKDTVDTIDDLAVSIKNGPGDFIWRVGAHRKIQSIANNYAIKRKGDSVGTKSDDAKKVLETSESVIAEITKTGSDFGGTISGITSDGEGISFSSGRKQSTEALRTNRHSQFKSVIGESGSRPESLELSLLALREEDSELASSVEEILDSESIEEVIERIENAAQKMHSGFDRRVRVRMNEDEISELSKSGKIRTTRDTDSPVVPGVSRRAQRLSLSSGAKGTPRKDRETEFAEKVKERIEAKLSKISPPKLEEGLSPSEEEKAIRKHIDDWFDNLPDAELNELGAKRFYLPDGKPLTSKTTGRVIYQTENNEVAASLLSLGQTVEMPEHKRGESAMVKQAAGQIKKALKKLSKENQSLLAIADLCKFYIEGVNVFCGKNLKIDRLEMPQVGGRAVNNESMALRLWGSGLATAETGEAHQAYEDGKLTVGLKARLNTLGKGTTEADELKKDIEVLQLIGTGFEGSGVEQKDITPEQQQVMDKYGVGITARELKRLGEKWNRAATARMEGKEPDPSDELTDEERKNFFSNIDYSMIEPDGVDAFTNFLKMLGVGIQEDRIAKPDELLASQRELNGPKVDNISENILKAVKNMTGMKDPAEKKKEIERLRKEHGLFKKILISKEGYIVDGHHRIIGKVVTNGVLSEDIPGLDQDDLDLLGLPVRQVDMGIIELLTVSRIYQDFLGLKAASLSATDDDPFKTAGVVGKKSKKLITDAEDMHGIDKIPKITQQEFDDAHEKLKTELEEKTDEIYARGQFIQVDSVGLNNTKESKLYKKVQLKRQKEATDRVNAGKARSPGLKENRDRSVLEYGMKWKPEYSEVKSVEESKTWDGWDEVEVTEVDLSSDILPTESHLKGSSIDKVVSGNEPLREGYYANLVIELDGKMYISDGHNRVAMNRALGNQKIQARVVDLRKIEKPWGEQKPEKSNYGGYDLVEPDNPLPDSGKYPEDIVDAADKQRERLKPVEKEITKTLIDLSNKHNAVMIGLAARFKSVKSLARKVNDERGSRTPEEAAADMSDVIRYTMTYTPENYVSGAKSVINDLQSAGYKLTVKNYWKTGDPYQGINIAAVHPDGTRFELQFHTPQSAVEKEIIHEVYDDYRVETDPKKRWKLYDRMTRMAERIDIPVEPGIDDIGETRFQDFSLASGARIGKPEAPVRRSGATKKMTNDKTGIDANTGRSVGKDRNKKESVKKDVAAEWFSAFESVEGLEDKNRLNSNKKLREYYESVGLGKDVRDDLMPVSGYLVHKSHIRKKKNEMTKNRSGNIGPDAIFETEDNDVIGDGLTAFGDVEIVLKPEVSVRTSYGKGSGIQNGHRPVMMDSTSIDDIAHAFSSPTKNNPENRMSDSVIGLLASSIDGDFSRVSKNNKTNSFENFEAHILGGFDQDEVDSINYPYSKLSKISKNEDISDVVNDNTIADVLRKKGFTQEEIDYYYSVGGDKQINTESMQKLKEYRMANKIKKKYSDLGFPNLKIAHPQGFNIENPRTYSKASRGIEDIEKLLRQEIIKEIMLQADELLKDMRKNKKTNLISKVGSGV